ncbi:cytochrome P450 2G1 isoform X1 [Anolis carolinensis]|nr:PREDICTED: cytochrome P450 2G1 isoform X2 [Anolis carolinensis]|eukprot:XP_003222946.2 PREDICTED: cytochrome P450 2G1 isoform X2 [Anolis carolinensis]
MMEWTVSVTFFLVVFISFYLLLSSKRKRLHKKKLPPGPTPLPLIGNFLQIKSSETLKSLLKIRDKYGPVFTVYFGSRPVLVLCGHDAVKEALIDKAEQFSGRITTPIFEQTFQQYGVVFANGERWKQLRRFSLTILKNFGMGRKSIEERIQEEAQFLLEEFQKTKEKPFEPSSFLSRAVSNIICSIVFGDRFDYEDKEFQSLMEMIHNAFQEMSSTWSQLYDIYVSFLKYFPGPHSRVHHILEELRLFIAKRVKKNQETLDSNSPRDFIDSFLIQIEKEKGNPDSGFDIKNLELTTLCLFFGGTETVSSTLRYGFLLLMKYPKVQAKVHDEIDRVIGHNRIPNIEDRSQMPYTDAVIHEIQRFSDLLPMSVAHMVTCDTEFRGYFIPKGMIVYPMLTSVLHDPTMFKSPNVFNPENFLDENGRFKTNDAFVPFSSGKRICLGESLARMELFIFFTTILQSFYLKSLVPPEDIDITPQECGFATIAPLYQLSIIPRRA